MIKIKNIYWMLAYAFDIIKEKGIQSIKTEEFDNIYNLLSAILVKSLNYQLKKGLNREYVVKTEELTNIKGKIKISDSIKYNTIKKHRLICEYDDFSVNYYMNQIIKTTLLQLIRIDSVDIQYRKSLKRILYYFEDVDEIFIHNIDWNKLIYNKNNITYRTIMNICYLIIEGLLLSTEKGEKKIAEFIDEERMYMLYEKFVREYYKKHFPMLGADVTHIKWDIPEDEAVNLLPNMKTDITLKYKGKTLIIDTKYYGHIFQKNPAFQSQSLRNSNIYQIYTYVKNKDVDKTGNVSGMLLYAKTDEMFFPDQKNTIGNNLIFVRTLDLTHDFEKVMEQLDDIAFEFTGYEVEKRKIVGIL